MDKTRSLNVTFSFRIQNLVDHPNILASQYIKITIILISQRIQMVRKIDK
jgi:hypothetical protein